MRILHITPYAHAFYGGPNTAVRMMARLAIDSGFNVDVATINTADHGYPNLKDSAVRVEGGAFFHYFQSNYLPNWFFSKSMKCWLELNIKKYDVVHLHVPFTAPFMIGARLCQRFQVPYVVTLHGLMDPWCLKQKSWKKIPYLYILEKKNLHRASFLHTTSDMEADFFKSFNFGSKVITFPLAVAELSGPIFFKPRLSELKTASLLFLGRIHPVKALPNIFKAIRSLHERGQDVELNIAGDGDSSYVLALKKMAIKEGVADRIYWHGQVDVEGRDRLFAKVNIFVMASYHENFGLAAAEAMASGLPVVLSDQVGLAKDVIEFNAGLIVPCDDPEAIATSIQGLMRAEKWLVHSKGAQDLVRNKYGVKTVAKSLVSMYKKACI